MGRILTLWAGFLGLGYFASLEALVRPEVALAGKFALILGLLIGAVIGVAALFCFLAIWILDRFGPLWTYRFPRWKVAWHLLRSQSSAEPLRHRFFRSLGETPPTSRVLLTLGIVTGTTLTLSQLSPSTGNPMSLLTELKAQPWIPDFYSISLFATLMVVVLLSLRISISKATSATGAYQGQIPFLLAASIALGTAFKAAVLVPVTQVFGLSALAPHIYGVEGSMGYGLYGLSAVMITLSHLLGVRWARKRKDALPQLRMKRRLTLPTFIATVGIAVGVWALIVVLSVMEGFGGDLREKILQVDAHVHIESQQLDRPVPDAPVLVKKLRSLDEVQSVHPMVIGRAMITTDLNTSSSVDIKGIDPFTYGENQKMHGIVPPNLLERLTNPESLLPDHITRRILKEAPIDDTGDEDGFTAPSRIFPGILLGSELAESLGVRTGDRVQVLSPEGDESPFGSRPRTASYRVAGTFRSGMYQYDLRLAFLTYWDAASFFRLEKGPNHIEVVAHNKNKIETILKLSHQESDTDSTAIRSWKQMNQALLSALDLERIAMFLVLGFIVLVASFNIIGSLVLVIVEKAREIAILRAMGSSGAWVGRVFLNVGAFIGLIGIGTGLLLGLLTCYYIKAGGVSLPHDYYLEKMPVDVDPLTISLITVIAALVVLLSTLFPTIKASRLTPTEGLRNE